MLSSVHEVYNITKAVCKSLVDVLHVNSVFTKYVEKLITIQLRTPQRCAFQFGKQQMSTSKPCLQPLTDHGIRLDRYLSHSIYTHAADMKIPLILMHRKQERVHWIDRTGRLRINNYTTWKRSQFYSIAPPAIVLGSGVHEESSNDKTWQQKQGLGHIDNFYQHLRFHLYEVVGLWLNSAFSELFEATGRLCTSDIGPQL